MVGKKISEILRAEKGVLQNFFALSVLQVAQYLLPLVTIPYLIRVIGVEKIGLISFASAIGAGFGKLTDYGFNFTATRDVAMTGDDCGKVSEIYNSVQVIKFALVAASFVILCFLIAFFQKLRNNQLVYLYTFGQVVGGALLPVWFFQGIEKMKFITVLKLSSKLAYTISIFLFVRQEENYLLVPLLTAIASVSVGLIGFLLPYVRVGIKFKIPGPYQILTQLKKGWPVFVSNVCISGYTDMRILAVGILTNNVLTGYYTIAEKLMNVIQTFPLASLVQAAYPRLGSIYVKDPVGSFRKMKTFQAYTTLLYAVGLPLVYLLSPLLVRAVAGTVFPQVTLVFRLLLISVFIINANAFRVQFLLIAGKDKLYLKIHFFSSLIGIILIFLGTYLWSYLGPAIVLAGVEFAVLVATPSCRPRPALEASWG